MKSGKIVAPGAVGAPFSAPRLATLLGALFLGACTDSRPLGSVTTDAGNAPIQVLVWNNALAFGHASRALAIPDLLARELTDNVRFDTTYAHIGSNYQDGDSDEVFDASVFTDEDLDKYDVVMFLNTTGNTIDDGSKAIRRQALQDFIEKKGRGFVGTHSATDTYKLTAADPWPWYVDFIGTNYASHTIPDRTPGVTQYVQGMTHPILSHAKTPNPWNRSEEWFVFTRDPLSSPIAGVTILLTCHDQINTTERPSAWVHQMPPQGSAARGGRLFYTAFGHYTSTFEEPLVIDLIMAGIKWAAGRL